MKIKYNLILICTLALQACAPLSTNYSARTVGNGNWDISAGSAIPNPIQPYIRITRGFTDNLDIGAVGEVNGGPIGGLWAKYAFANNPTDWSFALAGGAGYAAKGLYVYGGPIISYKYKWLEPYFSARGVYNTDDASYAQLTLGNNIWIADKLGLNLNINGLLGGSSTTFVGSAGLIYRF